MHVAQRPHRRLHAISAGNLVDAAITHICQCVIGAMDGPGLTLEALHVWIADETSMRRGFVRPVFRSGLGVHAARLLRRAFPPLPTIATGRLLRAAIGPGDVVYVWTPTGQRFIDDLRRAGVPAVVVRDKINCRMEYARPILERAYSALGWRPAHGITDAAIAAENAGDAACDYLFSTSPNATESLLSGGVPQQRILETTYGFEPGRIHGTTRHDRVDGLNVLFVGLLSVRKGIPWLLEAWRKARIRGRLVLAGRVADEVANGCPELLQQDGVQLLGPQRDVGALFRGADVFVLPTWEEGSPLVTFEALACGTPVITTSMGAGHAIRHEREGLLVPPGDSDSLAAALQRLAHDVGLRRQLAAGAAERGVDYSWDRVGARRRELLLDALDEN
jgi:glycosyltransferase involved in cell wall biosynthesis